MCGSPKCKDFSSSGGAATDTGSKGWESIPRNPLQLRAVFHSQFTQGEFFACRDQNKLASLLEAQRQIGQAAKELPASDRLSRVQTKLAEVQGQVDQIGQQSFPSTEEEQRAKDGLLRQLESRFRELSEMTKAWKTLKQAGRAALPPAAQMAFDKISKACAARGLFINPTGELESMLTEHGIQARTDKKGWITQALQLVPSLGPDDAKNPWKFLKAVHEHLQRT